MPKTEFGVWKDTIRGAKKCVMNCFIASYVKQSRFLIRQVGCDMSYAKLVRKS